MVKMKRQKRVELVCILTGVSTIQSRQAVEKQAKKLKFDNTEDYINFFISRDARKLLAKGFSELEIRKQHNCKETKTIPFYILKCYVKKFKSKDAVDRKRQKKVAEEYKQKPIIMQWKGTEQISLLKNKEMCQTVTQFACWRPDIYLDYGCQHCVLAENCACPIKNLKKTPRSSKIKRTLKNV
jgi:hypothetical protein